MPDNKLTGNLLLPEGWLDGSVTWDENGTITALEGERRETAVEGKPKVVAGFLDPHVHGGNGADTMRGAGDVRRMLRFHATQGTVGLAPTTMTAPAEEIAMALDGVESVQANQHQGEAEVLGVHLEGPFINPKRLGAQPPFTIAHDPDLVADWLGRARLVIATIAPEIENGMELLAQLVAAGVKVQLGHTDATASQAYAALQAGASGFTHLYNAMPSQGHRTPGVVECALAWGQHAELISDMEHVSEASFRAAVRAIPNAYAITDATAAAGCPDGEFKLGKQAVVKRGGTCRTKEGGLAGTALTMWQCRQNLLGIGLSEHLAQEMVSSRIASYLELDDLGEIAIGKAASLVRIVDEQIEMVWVRGKQLASVTPDRT